MDTAVALSYFKVCVLRSDFPYLDRFQAPLSDEAAISNIVLTVLKALTGYSPHHLLSPLLDLLSSDPEYHPRSFATPTARHDYHRVRAEELKRIQESLQRRFSHTPITVLVTDTKENQWATTTKFPGMEHTIILEQRLVTILRSETPQARLFVFMAVYRELAHLFQIWYVPHSFDRPIAITPKTMIDPTNTEPANIKDDVGSFVEWASMGGVADWSDEQGLFLSLENGQVRYITTAEAQAWWDAVYYPHLVEFLDARQSRRPRPTHPGASPDTRPPKTSTTPLNERSRTLSAAPSTPPIASSPLPSTPEPPTTPTPAGSSSVGPIRSSQRSTRSRTPYAPPKATQDIQPDSDSDKVPFRTMDDLLTSGMEQIERLPGEPKMQWLARVIREATKAHPRFVPAPPGASESLRDVWRCMRD